MKTEAAYVDFLHALVCSFSYMSFVGNGDSAVYRVVANIYCREYPVLKFECINHVSKQLEKQLPNLKHGKLRLIFQCLEDKKKNQSLPGN